MQHETVVAAILRQLALDGIEQIFGNPGSSEESILDALRNPEFGAIRYYLGLQEGTVVGMADAWARAAPPKKSQHDAFAWRRPAFVQLHSYAGLANGLGMIYAARRGCTPMVIIAGEAGLRYDALDGQMAADLCSIARPFVKSDANGPCAWRLVDPQSALRLLRRAIKTASTQPYGPVFLALPLDVLDLPNYEDLRPTIPVRTTGLCEESTLQEAARILASAEQPMILMGDGIAASAAQPELTAVAELLGAVVWGGNCTEVNIPASHPLFGGYLGHMFGTASAPITSQADVMLICGTTVLPEVFPALFGVFRPNCKVLHFDLNTVEIGKNHPISLGGLADPKAALGRIASLLRSLLSENQRATARQRIAQLESQKRTQRVAALAADSTLRDRTPLHASQFMEQLGGRLANLTKPSIIFDEALTHSPELQRYVPQNTIGTYFQTRAGMLGTGLPGALGLKIAYPDRQVFGFSGDGGSISTIQALSTASRHGIGAKFVVCNNRSYRILKYNLREYRAVRGLPPSDPFPPEFDLNRPDIRFDELARAQGVQSVRVAQASDIAPAIDQALADDRPFLIDLVVGSQL